MDPNLYEVIHCIIIHAQRIIIEMDKIELTDEVETFYEVEIKPTGTPPVREFLRSGSGSGRML